jgi:DNA-binding transcriptional LysR family regulator
MVEMAVALQHLAYLAAVAREQHFGRAAGALGVTQPTLSAGLRRLEAEVGFPLVRRGQRYEGLTPEGEQVLGWAQRVLADVDGLEETVDAMRRGLSGRLRLGVVPTSISSVALLTTPFREAHPGVTVSVYSLNSRQIERGLADYELEVGLTYLDSEPLEGVRTLPLYRERYLLLTEGDGPLAGRADVAWAEAAALPLCLLTADMQNRRIVDALFAEAGASPRPVLETNSVSTLYLHVRDGGLSTVLAHAWLHQFGVPRGMRAIPLVAPRAMRSMGLVWLDRDPEPILARALIEVATTLDLEVGLRR